VTLPSCVSLFAHPSLDCVSAVRPHWLREALYPAVASPRPAASTQLGPMRPAGRTGSRGALQLSRASGSPAVGFFLRQPCYARLAAIIYLCGDGCFVPSGVRREMPWGLAPVAHDPASPVVAVGVRRSCCSRGCFPPSGGDYSPPPCSPSDLALGLSPTSSTTRSHPSGGVVKESIQRAGNARALVRRIVKRAAARPASILGVPLRLFAAPLLQASRWTRARDRADGVDRWVWGVGGAVSLFSPLSTAALLATPVLNLLFSGRVITPVRRTCSGHLRSTR